jgi:hypothetical protein
VIASFVGLSVLMPNSLELLFEAKMKTKKLYFKNFPINEKITNNELAHKFLGVLWHKEGVPMSWPLLGLVTTKEKYQRMVKAHEIDLACARIKNKKVFVKMEGTIKSLWL